MNGVDEWFQSSKVKSIEYKIIKRNKKTAKSCLV